MVGRTDKRTHAFAIYFRKCSLSDLTIDINPPVLIPRQETEEWCGKLIQQIENVSPKPKKILDLCTGSGCIALAVAQTFPQIALSATDISEAALTLARANAAKNHISNVQFLFSDLFENIHNTKFDLIVGNPPYIAPEEWDNLAPEIKNWEDKHALVSEHHGLKIIEDIIMKAPQYLKESALPYGQLWLEIGYNQGAPVMGILKRAGFSHASIMKDFNGRDRVAIGWL